MDTNSKTLCNIINQLHLLQSKCERKLEDTSFNRNFDRLFRSFEALGFFMKNPIGEPYDLTRMDCEASIAGEGVEDLKIVEVIKPIIYFRNESGNHIVQPAVVIVESQK